MDRRLRIVVAIAVTLIAACTANETPAPPSAATPTAIATATVTGAPAPTTGPRSPSSPPPSASPIVRARWTKLELTGDAPAGIDLVGFDAGYATVGTRDPFEDPIAWFTSVGTAWQAASLANLVPNCPGWGPEGDEEVPDADTAAIASNGHQVVVVGAGAPHDPAGCADVGSSIRPIAWLSDDGRTWRRSEPFYTGGSNGRATAVWPTADGWEAFVEAPATGTPSIWRSSDGLHWESTSVLAEAGLTSVISAAATGGTVVLTGDAGDVGSTRPRVVASHDGGAWTPLDVPAGCLAGQTQVLAPRGEGLAMWIVRGDSRTCISVDLLTWSSRKLPMAIWRIAQTKSGAIALGDTCTGAGTNCTDPGLRAYLTTDGLTWTRIDHPPLPW